MELHVAGVTFAKKQAADEGYTWPVPDLIEIQKFNEKDLPEIRLVPEPENPYDSFAIRVDLPAGVYNGITYPQTKLGYIPKTENQQLLHDHPRKLPGGIILKIVGTTHKTQGIVIFLDLGHQTAGAGEPGVDTDDSLVVNTSESKTYIGGFPI